MKKLEMIVSLLVLAISFGATAALAAEPSPSPGPLGGKNVRAKMEEPHRAKAVGVRAADPSQNGRPNTSGALSPMNENSMGLGVQFDLTRPKKAAPKKADKDEEDSE